MVTMPEVEGVEHHYVDLGGGVVIHVADAGPADGPAVMLVHGFPQNWWEWHALIGPLAADGYRVLCPDLRGAGWSSAPRTQYLKSEMADDLAGVMDHLGIATVKMVAHDWGGPVAFIMMLRHPEKVSGFFGANTAAPFVKRDLTSLGKLWRLWYQVPLALPVVGPRIVAKPGSLFLRVLGSWVGGGYQLPDDQQQMYSECMNQPGHAEAGSRWYRSFQTKEMLSWSRGAYDSRKTGARVTVPVRWLTGTADPVMTPAGTNGYEDHIDDFEVELVPGVGHWIIDQRPDLVLDRLRVFLRL